MPLDAKDHQSEELLVEGLVSCGALLAIRIALIILDTQLSFWTARSSLRLGAGLSAMVVRAAVNAMSVIPATETPPLREFFREVFSSPRRAKIAKMID